MAQPQLALLRELDVAPLFLWDNYNNAITRAETAYLLVNIFEQLNRTRVDTSGSEFTDIENHILESGIKKAFNLSFINGVSAEIFNPDAFVTRQEAATMICNYIARVEKLTIPTGSRNLAFYADAGQISGWAAPYVTYAHENNIMQGSGGNFEPRSNITREQMLIIIYRLIEKYEWVKG